jgi:hypothetical protein
MLVLGGWIAVFRCRIPFLKNDPKNPSNRRISIVVMNAATEAGFLRDGRQTLADPGQGLK